MTGTTGTVKDGVVVLDEPLPNGTRVEVRLAADDVFHDPEFQEELNDWQALGAQSLEMMDRYLENLEKPDAQTR